MKNLNLQFIDLARQQAQIRAKIEQRILKVLDHGQYIMGPEVAELENILKNYVGSKHCISVANGTDALQIALMSLEIKPGDEVITSPFTFVANSETIALLGARAVYVDIDPQTYNLDPQLLEAKITSKTKAIMPISLFGQSADFHSINKIASKYNIPVIEDAAQSFGSTHHSQRACSLATISCTSFFPSKPLGCYGDGGACFTSDEYHADKMRRIRAHGQKSRYHHTEVGVNSRLDTLQAAILIAKMEIFEDEVRLRQEIGLQISNILAPYVVNPFIETYNTSVYAQYSIRVNNRTEFMTKLKNVGIPTSVHYPTPAHLQPAYSLDGYKEGDFPITEKAAREIVSIPFHPYLNREEITLITDEVIRAVT